MAAIRLSYEDDALLEFDGFFHLKLHEPPAKSVGVEKEHEHFTLLHPGLRSPFGQIVRLVIVPHVETPASKLPVEHIALVAAVELVVAEEEVVLHSLGKWSPTPSTASCNIGPPVGEVVTLERTELK